jgi:hypothetical protein
MHKILVDFFVWTPEDTNVGHGRNLKSKPIEMDMRYEQVSVTERISSLDTSINDISFD